jgi:hypothetical protein
MADSGQQQSLADERRRYEQQLMRIGRRLEAIGQLLVQDPSRMAGKGFDLNESVTGSRPVQIEMDELRDLFDRTATGNVGELLERYHRVLGHQKKDLH